MRLLLYTGKGGVGKTTTAAATALCGAERGLRTLLVSADAAHSLADVLDLTVGPEPKAVAPNLQALEVDARVEMGRHWGRIRDFLVSLFRYQGIEEVVAEELALLPGAEELTTLLAVEEQLQSREYDFVVVDCAPTDTTLRLLTLPEVAHGSMRILLKLQRALAAVITPLAQGLVPVPLPDSQLFSEAEALLYEKLRALRRRVVDRQTSVRLVVTPERMVIDEARRAYSDLALFDLACDAVVMNRLLPEAAVREPFFREWGRLQDARLAEVTREFEPLRVLSAPLREDEVTGLEALSVHGRELFRDCRPEAMLSPLQRISFARQDGRYCVRLPLHCASAADLDVGKLNGELLIRAGPVRRSLVLPRRLAGLEMSEARLDEGELSVYFSADPGSGG